MNAPLSREDALEQLGKVVRDAWSDDATAAEDQAGRASLQAAIAASDVRRPAVVWIAAAAVLVLLVTFALFLFYPSDLKYTIAASEPTVGGYLQAPVGGSAAVAHFTDGTDVRIAPGGRARVVNVDAHGARIALEQGRASLAVVHKSGAHWSVDAGPFTVAVTGTQFDVDWSGSDGVLVVALHRGSVTVRGPLAQGGVGLAAGQRLVANLAEGRLHIESLSAPPEPVTAPAPSAVAAEPLAAAPSNVVATAAPEPSAPTDRESRSVGETAQRSWSKRVAAGDFRGVLGDADAAGMPRVLADGSLADLVAVADAARYTGEVDVAGDALTALRRRFPASTDAKSAAFLLGRLAEGRGAETEALGWYARYLTEAPKGAFVAEALGRQMLATRKVQGQGAARALAQTYLVRFPNGPYAKAATELVAPE